MRIREVCLKFNRILAQRDTGGVSSIRRTSIVHLGNSAPVSRMARVVPRVQLSHVDVISGPESSQIGAKHKRRRRRHHLADRAGGAFQTQ